jgi:nucleoside-diphosphate-sugar epimerase
MRILVVGGAGYVGGAVTDILLKKNFNFTVYDNLLYESEYLKNCDFIYGDVRDYKKINNLLKNYDCVIWIAALVGDGACSINPEITDDINFKAVENLTNNFDGRIIFFSTCSVYGAQHGILDEKSSLNPLSAYASTKLKAENVLMKKNSIIFRLGTLFGLSDTYSRIRMDLVVNTLTAKAIVENKINIFGGEQYRPLLHVRDAALAIVESISKDQVGIFNLSLENYKIIDIARLVEKSFPGLEVNLTEIPFQDARNYKVNNDKCSKSLNFLAKTSVLDGILEVKKLLENKRIKDVNNPRYTNQKYLEFFKDKIKL